MKDIPKNNRISLFLLAMTHLTSWNIYPRTIVIPLSFTTNDSSNIMEDYTQEEQKFFNFATTDSPKITEDIPKKNINAS